MIFIKSKFNHKNCAKGADLRLVRGQVMLLTILILSGMILSATTIAGLLMLYQIRQSADITNSAKAFYAADTGLEWRLYNLIKIDGVDCEAEESTYSPPVLLSGQAKFKVSCESVEEVVSATPPDPETGAFTETIEKSITIKSIGEAVKNYRALEFGFTMRFTRAGQ